MGWRNLRRIWWTQVQLHLEVTEGILQKHFARTLFFLTNQQRQAIFIYTCSQHCKLWDLPANKNHKSCLHTQFQKPRTPLDQVQWDHHSQPQNLSNAENRGTIRGIQFGCKIWPLNWFKLTHACKTKTLRETTRHFRTVLDLEENPIVRYVDNSQAFWNACGDLRWESLYICTSSVWDEWCCRKGSKEDQRLDFNILLAVRTRWTMAGRSTRIFFLFAQCSRFFVRWRNTTWTAMLEIEPIIVVLEQKSNIDRISTKDEARLRQFGNKVFSGTFMVYALHAGGSWKWDILVADVDELHESAASEVFVKRINANAVFSCRKKKAHSYSHAYTISNAVLVPKEKGTFIFACAIGPVKLPAKGLEVRTFEQIRHTEEGEEHRSDLRGNLIMQNNNKKHSVTWKRSMICGAPLEASFTVITFKRDKKTMCAAGKFVSHPHKYIDVVRGDNVERWPQTLSAPTTRFHPVHWLSARTSVTHKGSL